MECRAFTIYNSIIKDRLISEAKIVYNENTFDAKTALWDTGATITCVSKTVIQKLKLVPIGMIKLLTPSGEKLSNMYVIDIVLRNNVKLSDLKVAESEIGNQGIDVLIGMDVISHGDLSVNNYAGRTTFSFRVPSQSTTDYVQEILKKNSSQN